MAASRDGGGFVSFVLFFAAAMGAFFLLPGLLVAYSASTVLGLTLDTGQLWAFGATASGVFILVAWLSRGPIFALSWHAGACLFSTWVVAFAHWGLHAGWPLELVSKACPGLGG